MNVHSTLSLNTLICLFNMITYVNSEELDILIKANMMTIVIMYILYFENYSINVLDYNQFCTYLNLSKN